MEGQGKNGLSLATRITVSGVQTIGTDMVIGILRCFLTLGYTVLHQFCISNLKCLKSFSSTKCSAVFCEMHLFRLE